MILYIDENILLPNRVYRRKEREDRYNTFIDNYDAGHENWKFITLLDAFAKYKKYTKKMSGGYWEMLSKRRLLDLLLIMEKK